MSGPFNATRSSVIGSLKLDFSKFSASDQQFLHFVRVGFAFCVYLWKMDFKIYNQKRTSVLNLFSYRHSFRITAVSFRLPLIRFSCLKVGRFVWLPFRNVTQLLQIHFTQIDFFEKMVSKVLLLVAIIVALGANIAEADYGCEYSKNYCWATCNFMKWWCWTKRPGAGDAVLGHGNNAHCGSKDDCDPDWPCADGSFCFWGSRDGGFWSSTYSIFVASSNAFYEINKNIQSTLLLCANKIVLYCTYTRAILLRNNDK